MSNTIETDATLDPDEYGSSVTLRSHERTQLDTILETAVRVYGDRDQNDAVASFEACLDRLDEATVSLPDDDWEQVVLALSDPDVKSEHGANRVTHLQRKLAWRALENEEKIQPIIPRV